MKTLIISIFILSFSSCNSGSSSGAGTGNITSPTSPTMPETVNELPLNQLFKSDLCFVEANNQSSLRYITKISATELKLEADLFSQPNCENAPAPIVMLASSKRVYTITGHSNSIASGFTSLTLRQDYSGIMPLDEMFRTMMESLFTVNGPWIITEYHNMSGELNQSVNGTLTTRDMKYVGSLLTFDGSTFQ